MSDYKPHCQTCGKPHAISSSGGYCHCTSIQSKPEVSQISPLVKDETNENISLTEMKKRAEHIDDCMQMSVENARLKTELKHSQHYVANLKREYSQANVQLNEASIERGCLKALLKDHEDDWSRIQDAERERDRLKAELAEAHDNGYQSGLSDATLDKRIHDGELKRQRDRLKAEIDRLQRLHLERTKFGEELIKERDRLKAMCEELVEFLREQCECSPPPAVQCIFCDKRAQICDLPKTIL